MGLTTSNLNLGFIPDVTNTDVHGRRAIAKEFKINTLCQEPMQGGILEYGTAKALPVQPNVSPLPEKDLLVAFSSFGAVYVICWFLKDEIWYPLCHFTTPERLAYITAKRSDGKTYCSECQKLRLKNNSVVGYVNNTQQPDV